MSSSRHHTTQSHAAYEPRSEDIQRGWLLVVAGLVVLALAAIAVRPVCRPDQAGATESGFGVRHQQRGTAWYHCEPWVRRLLTRG